MAEYATPFTETARKYLLLLGAPKADAPPAKKDVPAGGAGAAPSKDAR